MVPTESQKPSGGRWAKRAGRGGGAAVGGEAAGRIDQGDASGGVVREGGQEMAAAVIGDGDDPIGGERGLKHAMEAAYAIGFGGPGGLFDKAEIVQGIDEAGAGEAAGAVEIIAVDDIGAAEAGFEIGGGMAPEALRLFEVGGRGEAAEARLGGAEGGGGALRIPEEVAECGIEDVLVGAGRSGQGSDQAIGIESAAGFGAAGLADVESDFHEGRSSSRTAWPTHSQTVRAMEREMRRFQRTAAESDRPETSMVNCRRSSRGTPRSSSTKCA